MSDIDRRAGFRIAKSVRKTEQADDTLPDEVQPANVPILLVRAQDDIPTEESGDVKRLVRASLEDDKGNEVEIGEPFEVFNRGPGLAVGADFFVRWIDGGYEVFSRVATGVDGVPTCGSCFQIDGTYSIEIVEGLDAPEEFLVALICGGDPITLTYTGMVGDDHVWTSGSVSVNCNGDATTITVTLTVSGFLPGEFVLTTTGDGGAGTWDNEVAWQPKVNMNMRLQTVDPDCLCTPFEPHPCLTPSPGV